jgi:threonine dehydrogenase-like Zn-dependent dehydrogenase
MGKQSVEVVDVPDPKILNSRDAIVKISSTAICGSDLHLYNGLVPTMKKGDVLGHEFMGEVVEVGKQVDNLQVGDRVVVPFPIACGACLACERGQYSVCENSNPNAPMAEKLLGRSPSGIFGYSHMLGGYPGEQAEYARVPFADVARSRSRTDCLTSPCCSSPTSSRPGTWAPTCATSPPATWSRSGAQVPSVSSRSPAPSCSGRSR